MSKNRDGAFGGFRALGKQPFCCRQSIGNPQPQRGKRIPDIIGFVNGLPLVVFELKNPLRESADLLQAFNQFETYKDEIAELFVYNQALIISDGIVARLGSLSADFQRFTPWKVVDEKIKRAVIF